MAAGCSLSHDIDGLVSETDTAGAGGAGAGGVGGQGGVCVPRTCADASPACGEIDDGCGGPLTCGCTAPSACGASGVCECPDAPLSTGPKAPGVATGNNGSGFVAWSNVNAARSSTDDGAVAVATLPATRRSKNLQIRRFDFAAVPDDATIATVTLTVCRWKGNNTGAISVKDDEVQLIVAGQIITPPNLAQDISWIYHGGTCEETEYVFSPSEMGIALSPADVRDEFFGANFVVKNPLTTGNDAIANVDWMKMSVEYFEACTPASE
jgi:hypothetical protein